MTDRGQDIGGIMERFPGIACAWTGAEGKEEAEYDGVSDLERNTPVDETTVFPANSISKFITAICVMKLHEQKAIDIDAPANRFLKQWKLRRPDGSECDASVRSLLCHTAGILDGEDAFYGLRRGDPEISLIDILEGRTAYNNRPARAEKPQESEPKEETAETTVKESAKPGAVILVGDADMLYDPFCVRQGNFFGQTYYQPLNNNIAMLQNMAEAMAGDAVLFEIRSRGVRPHPFTKVKELERKAADKYQGEIKKFEEDVRSFQQELYSIQQNRSSKDKELLSNEQKEAVAKLKKKEAEARKNLKKVRKDMRKDIESLENNVMLLNIALMPLLVVIGGIALAITKRVRMSAK